MRGYFAVDVRDDESIGSVSDYMILFKSPGVSSPADLADCLEQGLRRVLFPDAIVFICIHREVEQLFEAFNNDDGVKQALERASSKVCVAICEIDPYGNFGKPLYIRNELDSLPLIETGRQERIFKEGLRVLFDSPNVLVPAPAGFIFVNPSTKRSKYFLRAEEALYETERVHFLAYAILSRIAKREAETQESIAVIFIDTMAIASLAYVLRELYHELYLKPRPRVESFHSYVGIKNVQNPRAGTSLCIVSASSSMTMQRDWQQQTRCFPSEVVTLITFKSAKDSEQAVYVFDHVDSMNSHEELSGLRDLRIVGESFTHEKVPLKSVLLTVRAHKQEKWFDVGQEYSKSKLFSLMKAEGPGDKIRPIFVDGTKLFENAEFLNFVEKEMMQRVPLSVQAILYQDDNSSKSLAGRCADRIRKIRGDEETPRIINANELESVPPLEKEGALLIVAAVIGHGTRLLSISRDLRDLHVGARHYMIGFQLAESIDDCAQLKSNLKFSAIKSAISVSIMESLAIGRTVGDAYSAEKTLLGKWKGLTNSPRLTSRVNELRDRKGVSQGAFLPSTLQGEENLKLRKDFAYWRDGYNLEMDHSVAVLLTAASMLQYAREFNKFKEDGHRLASDTFQQVVLDPENFARYNDGVIQAALLRAAHPSELDYSSHEEVGRRMTDILSGIFRLHARQQGEAALEFALAIKNGWLKLSDSDMSRLKQEVNKLHGSGVYFELLRDLLGIGSSDAWSEEATI